MPKSILDSILDANKDIKNKGAGLYDVVKRKELERMGIKEWKPSVGDNFILMIPPVDVANAYGYARHVQLHRNIGVQKRTFVCKQKTFGQECEVCQYIENLRDGDVEATTIKQITPKSTYLLFMIDMLNQGTADEGVKFFLCPGTIYEDIIAQSVDKRTKQPLNLADVNSPSEISFSRQGTGPKNTRYSGVAAKPLNGSYRKEWLDVPAFDDILLVHPSADIVEALPSVSAQATAQTPVREEAGIVFDRDRGVAQEPDAPAVTTPVDNKPAPVVADPAPVTRDPAPVDDARKPLGGDNSLLVELGNRANTIR